MTKQQAIVEARAAFERIRLAAMDLSYLYEQHPFLNEVQPAMVQEAIPKDFDEWGRDLYCVAADWKRAEA